MTSPCKTLIPKDPTTDGGCKCREETGGSVQQDFFIKQTINFLVHFRARYGSISNPGYLKVLLIHCSKYASMTDSPAQGRGRQTRGRGAWMGYQRGKGADHSIYPAHGAMRPRLPKYGSNECPMVVSKPSRHGRARTAHVRRHPTNKVQILVMVHPTIWI